MQARSRSHRIPGPTSFWEVVAIPPEAQLVGKVFSLETRVSLQSDNKTTKAEYTSRNTRFAAISHHKKTW
jgi:hypothetical protein